jgi:hypothetical protein
MAFVVGSIVAVPNHGGSITDPIQSQSDPPNYGVIADITSAPLFAVLWANGRYEAAVPGAILDELVEPDVTEINRLRGRIVQLNVIPASPEYQGIVVNVYKRALAGGVPGPNLALVKSLSVVGFYYEVPAATLDPIPGR